MTPQEEEIKKATDQTEFRVSVLAKIDALHLCVDGLDKSFSQFNHGMGKRIDEIEKTLLEHAVMMPGIKDGIKDWRDSKQWIIRLVVGAVIVALLGLVIVKK